MSHGIDAAPNPFFEHSHEELRRRLRAGWHADLESTARAFAAGDLDESQAARRFVQDLAQDGLLAQAVAGDVRSLVVAREEAATVSGFADNQLALQGLGSHPIRLGGSRELVQRFAEPAAFGACIAAFALTEPDAGSDARALRTTARRAGDEYVLTGTKTLISNAGVADFYTVFAREEASGEFLALVVEAGTPGFEVARRFELLSPHPIGELAFDGCRVPASQRLGAEGEGLTLAFRTLERFRPSVGAAALGLASRALAEALRHVRQRMQFGRPLESFQITRQKLADMWASLELGRLSVHRAAWLLDREAPAREHTLASSLAKLTATEAAQRVVDEAVQLLGGRGVVRGEVVEHLYRDVRALRIYEGTSEIQRLILARALLEEC